MYIFIWEWGNCYSMKIEREAHERWSNEPLRSFSPSTCPYSRIQIIIIIIIISSELSECDASDSDTLLHKIILNSEHPALHIKNICRSENASLCCWCLICFHALVSAFDASAFCSYCTAECTKRADTKFDEHIIIIVFIIISTYIYECIWVCTRCPNEGWYSIRFICESGSTLSFGCANCYMLLERFIITRNEMLLPPPLRWMYNVYLCLCYNRLYYIMI